MRGPLFGGAFLAAATLGAGAAATPAPLPTGPNFGTYSVLEIGKPGVPRLSSLQMRWIELIHADPAYRPRWPNLRWTIAPLSSQETPVAVFEVTHRDVLATMWFPIIGQACNVMFDPSEGSVMITPHFDQPCKPSEQLLVVGEKALLGWEP